VVVTTGIAKSKTWAMDSSKLVTNKKRFEAKIVVLPILKFSKTPTRSPIANPHSLISTKCRVDSTTFKWVN